MSLIVAQVNVFVKNPHRRALKRQLRATGAHVIGTQEAQRFGKIKGYTRLAAPDGMHAAAREVAVYVRSDVMAGYRGHTVKQVTNHVNDKLAHDRWMVTVSLAFGIDGLGLDVICTHANAGVKGQDGAGPLRPGAPADENERLAGSVVRAARSAGRRGAAVVTLADWNATQRNTGPGTPVVVHQKAHLAYKARGVDGIGWDDTRLTLMDFEAVEAFGSDHPLLVATYAS